MDNNLPSPLDQILDKFVRLHGDRVETDAPRLLSGFAWIASHRVVLVASTQTTQVPQPAVLRQFRRLVELAGRLHRPLLLWQIDSLLQPTETSLPLLEAGHRLASTLMQVPVPIIAATRSEESGIADRLVPISNPESLRDLLVEEIGECLQMEPVEVLKQRRERLENALDISSAQ